MKQIFYFPLVIALSSASLAQGQGFDFKGLPLGSSVVDVKEKFPDYYCEKPRNNNLLSDTNCTLSPETKCLFEQAPHLTSRLCRESVVKAMTYAGVKADISLMFYENKLGMANIIFGPDSFLSVVASLRDKFGEPTKKKSEAVTNRMGVTFENEILQWKNSSSTIQVKKYDGRVDKSTVKIFDDAYFVEFEKRNIVKFKQGAKDL